MVKDVKGQFIAAVPVPFMEQGHCRSWEYILDVTKTCVEQQDGVLFTAQGAAIELTQTLQLPPVEAGYYTYKRVDAPEEACSFAKGPESKTRGKPPSGRVSESTVSHSSRSSVNQNNFRTALIARDSVCLLTGTRWDSCAASHIVPFSRPDIYARELGVPPELVNLYGTSAGLLVNRLYHRALDVFEWSLRPQGDNYVVHFFTGGPEGKGALLHGKVIDSSHFRSPNPAEKPNPVLLRWHYRQCVQARFRGFAAKMSPADAIAEMSSWAVATAESTSS